jgi:dienelactone hydrolase
VRGETLLAKVLNDVSVGLDYLEPRHDVDSKRLGFIGHSYGGRMAIWASAVDDRIIAAASHCGCVNYADSMRREAGIQIEFCVPGIVKTFDVQDVVTLISPRALLISAATEDKWSQGAQAMYDHARSAFHPRRSSAIKHMGSKTRLHEADARGGLRIPR